MDVCLTSTNERRQSLSSSMAYAFMCLATANPGLSKRHFKRLRIAWGKTPWEPFTVIEVAAVIFALLAKAALEHEHPSAHFSHASRQLRRRKHIHSDTKLT